MLKQPPDTPWKDFRWNLKIIQLKTEIIFQTFVFGVQNVNFPGCTLLFKWCLSRRHLMCFLRVDIHMFTCLVRFLYCRGMASMSFYDGFRCVDFIHHVEWTKIGAWVHLSHREWFHHSEGRWLAITKRWRFVRGPDKPIHGSCTIYFPGGIVELNGDNKLIQRISWRRSMYTFISPWLMKQHNWILPSCNTWLVTHLKFNIAPEKLPSP